MTLSSSATREISIGNVILMAYRRAGLLNENQGLSSVKASVACQELNALVDYLETEGLFARTHTFETIEVSEGVSDYSLSATSLEAVGTAVWIRPGEDVERASAETPIQQISLEQWQTLGSKSGSGTPSLYFLDRSEAVPLVRLWLTPGAAEDGGHVRIPVSRLRSDNLNTNDSLDFERYWTDYFVWALAHRLAVSASLNLGKCAYLEQVASSALIKCKARAKQRGPNQASVMHRTQWSRP